MKRVISLAVVLLASTGLAEARPRDVLHFQRPVHAQKLAAQADSHIIYMNNCLPNGCTVKQGQTDSRVDTSDIASQNGVLTAWSYGQPAWDATMSCMRATFSRFNVAITDVDPGMTPHYEVMVAGHATQILGNGGNGVGGIADFPCQSVGNCDPYTPNALVFAFAAEFGNDPTEICAVAAQEIAHTWALDHVVDAQDPLTYNNFNGMRQYHDGEKCGSDCQGGQSPFGLSCTGSGGQATHLCSGNNQATQDEVSTMLTLFGPSAPPTPPTVAITSPADGATVMQGFAVAATVTDSLAVSKAELRIDGNLIGSSTQAPFSWTAPSNLGVGSHQLKVTGYNASSLSADASITVTIGKECSAPADCPIANDTCVDNRCVPGSNTPGGLGTPCTTSAECASQQCGDDGSGHQYCVEPCDPMGGAGCPSGFGCLANGTTGVCWPGADNGGGGGCSSNGTGGGGALCFGIGMIGLLARRRRPRS